MWLAYAGEDNKGSKAAFALVLSVTECRLLGLVQGAYVSLDWQESRGERER
jgi:hypothetical protein